MLTVHWYALWCGGSTNRFLYFNILSEIRDQQRDKVCHVDDDNNINIVTMAKGFDFELNVHINVIFFSLAITDTRWWQHGKNN